eukprot:Nk52_evm3s207 gene=Nk52_evmTU3s207
MLGVGRFRCTLVKNETSHNEQEDKEVGIFYQRCGNVLKQTDFSNSHLTVLQLGLAGLTRFPEELFVICKRNNSMNDGTSVEARVPNLRELHLDENQMADLPEGIKLFQQLRVLNLQRNQLTALPVGLTELSRLTDLYLGENNLKRLPVGMSKMHKLQRLWLRGNPNLCCLGIEVAHDLIENGDLDHLDLDEWAMKRVYDYEKVEKRLVRLTERTEERKQKSLHQVQNLKDPSPPSMMLIPLSLKELSLQACAAATRPRDHENNNSSSFQLLSPRQFLTGMMIDDASTSSSVTVCSVCKAKECFSEYIEVITIPELYHHNPLLISAHSNSKKTRLNQSFSSSSCYCINPQLAQVPISLHCCSWECANQSPPVLYWV